MSRFITATDRYIFRLGFLDGRVGFAFHSLQGFWNFLLVDVKIAEFRRYIERNGLPAFRRLLAEQGKINLPDPPEGADETGATV